MEIKEIIKKISMKYDSFYLYDENIIKENVEALKKDFKDVQFLYSVKANPASQVLKYIFSHGFGADAASLNEVKIAHSMGVSKEKIQYSAPGKQRRDIEESMDISTIIADSDSEIYRINEIAKENGQVVSIGVRINPNFTFSNDIGVSSKFGIDEEKVFEKLKIWNTLENIKIIGIHVHSKSQELDAKVIGDYYERMFHLAVRFQNELQRPLKFINMGSGLGISYSSYDNDLNTKELGKRMINLMKKFSDALSGIQIVLETGRFAVCKSGYYVTKVLDKKESMGKNYVILKNTLNGFIRPSLAQLVEHYAPEGYIQGSEPLFTKKDSSQIIVLTDEVEKETVTLVGNLCTATDIVADNIELPKLKHDDVIIMTNAGSYGAVLSPMQFSSQEPPKQLILHCDKSIEDAYFNL